jgi:hypothetical protein
MGVCNWVVRKLPNHEVSQSRGLPQVQERVKALSAIAPNAPEYLKAYFEYITAVQKELEKWRFYVWPAGSTQISPLLQKIEASRTKTSGSSSVGACWTLRVRGAFRCC